MTDAEIQAKFKSYDETIGLIKKDAELKINAATTEAAQWKKMAEDEVAKTKDFEAKAKKAEEEKKAALAEARKTEIKAFVDQAKKDARILPAQEEIVTKLMESMTSDAEVAKFASKDGSSVSHTQYSLLKQFIASLAPHKAFVSMTPGGVKTVVAPDNSTGGGEQKFTEVFHNGQKITAYLDDTDIDAKANAYIEDQRKVGRAVSYTDALLFVSAQMKQNA